MIGKDTSVFKAMVDQHARMWGRAGYSNSGMVISDTSSYDMKLAHECSKRLVELYDEVIQQRDAWAHQCNLASERAASATSASHQEPT